MNWKEHPLTAAAISCASTAAFFLTFVTPILEKHNINTITDLEQNLRNIESKASKENAKNQELINNLRSQNLEISKENKEQEIKILKLQEEDRFSAENPLPKGFREIGILDSYTKIKESYKNTDIDERKRWTSVNINDSLFKSATYYPLECKNSTRVSHILFQTKNAIDIYLENKNKQHPSIENQEKFEEKTVSTLLAIFREKYGKETFNEDEEYYFNVNNLWLARISKTGLLIRSLLSDEDLINSCNNPSYCPLPQSDKEQKK